MKEIKETFKGGESLKIINKQHFHFIQDVIIKSGVPVDESLAQDEAELYCPRCIHFGAQRMRLYAVSVENITNNPFRLSTDEFIEFCVNWKELLKPDYTFNGTPGEWVAEASNYWVVSKDKTLDRRRIVEQPMSDSKHVDAYHWPANAHAIAAAPDMIEAIKEAMQAYEKAATKKDGTLYDLSNSHYPRLKRALHKALNLPYND